MTDQPFHIGSYPLKSNLSLSPLAGYTNLPFRLTVRELGGLGLATTDLVNARSILEKNHKALKLIETSSEDFPLSVQLFGGVPEEMRDAALYVESLGIAMVDINMGCPVRKVVQVGGGSAMMTELSKTAKLVQGMVEAVKIPVTAKMRLGWDDNNITAPNLTRALADVGVAAVAVHGRTREQGFDGSVNIAGIRQVVEAVPDIPIIGNGDITTPEAAQMMIEKTGCAGVSMGRGAFYNPWLFQQTRHYLETGELAAEPGFEERIRVVRRHLSRMIEIFGEKLGCRMFRKVGPWYSKRFGPSNFFNKRIVEMGSAEEFEEILSSYIEWRKSFLNEDGELKSGYVPKPLKSVFKDGDEEIIVTGSGGIAISEWDKEQQPEVARRQAIPTPKGPVEVW